VDALGERGFDAGLVAHHDAGEGVLGEAGAAVAQARVEELRADALVGAHALADAVDVGAVGLAEVGHLVDEGDLGGEEVVGGVLDHLGAQGTSMM
jgi:hypothetical protein